MMAETAPMKTYRGSAKSYGNVRSPMAKRKKKKKATTGGTKHVVASTGGSL